MVKSSVHKKEPHHSNDSKKRPGTYVVHSIPSSQESRRDLPKKGESHAKQGALVSKTDPEEVKLPCIGNNFAADQSRMNVAAAPIEMRMAIKLNKVALLKQKTKKPKGALPLLNIPIMDEWPLDAKIPDLRNQAWPPRSLHFTRGKLGQPLTFRRNNFDLNDPKCHKTAFKLGQYTSLHDPHAVRYFKNKDVLSLLRKQQLINRKREVICNPKDYNRYRAFLSTLQSEGVNQKLQKEVENFDLQMQIQRAYKQEKRMEEFGNKAIERHRIARQIQKDVTDQKQSRARIQTEYWKMQIEAFDEWKRDERCTQTQELFVQEYTSGFRRQQVLEDRDDYRRRILGRECYDMKRADYNQKYDKLINKALREREAVDKVAIMKKRDEQMSELKDIVEATNEKRKGKWIRRYEKQIQYSQQNEEEIQAARRAKAGRELWLQRKYFDLWRKFIEKKLGGGKTDDAHNSSFKVDKEMKHLVTFLSEESGYDPKQNFFSLLLQNRKNVEEWAENKRRTLEDQKEAAEAAKKLQAEEAKRLEEEAKKLAELEETQKKKNRKSVKPKKNSKKKKSNDEDNLADDESEDLYEKYRVKTILPPRTSDPGSKKSNASPANSDEVVNE